MSLLFLLLLVERRGLRAFAEPRVWAFGALALAPAAIWYLHAHSLWLRYGNSLGMSCNRMRLRS